MMYVASLKTLSGKTQWDKNLIEGKKSATMNPIVCRCCLIKNLVKKNPVGQKLDRREKECSAYDAPPEINEHL